MCICFFCFRKIYIYELLNYQFFSDVSSIGNMTEIWHDFDTTAFKTILSPQSLDRLMSECAIDTFFKGILSRYSDLISDIYVIPSTTMSFVFIDNNSDAIGYP